MAVINNKPSVKIGIVAVSRDCFPESLSVNRRKALVEAYTKKYGALFMVSIFVAVLSSLFTNVVVTMQSLSRYKKLYI